MYSRDPFNLRRTSSSASQLLRAGPSPLNRRTLETSSPRTETAPEASSGFFSGQPPERTFSSETASNAPIMTSYGLPASSGLSQGAEVRQNTGRSRLQETLNSSAIGEKVTNFFTQGSDQLPMYKDKPYKPSRKIEKSLPPWLRERKYIAAIAAGVLFVMFIFGTFSSSKPSSKTKGSKSMFGSSSKVDWDVRAGKVKEVFQVSYSDYTQNGWGYDEYRPVSKSGRYMTPTGMGWIIVDALDTMMIMNLSTELAHARQWVANNLTYDQDHDVNTFETTIRMVGGLLSAHYLSVQFPGKYAPVKDDISDDMYIEKAVDLAERLLGAYDTASGVPLASINLHTRKGIPSHADAGASSTAEATTLQLEMKYISKLTGETHYWEKAEKVMKVIDDNNAPSGLVPIFVYADLGTFRGNSVRLGSRGDSYYEYLAKQYLQTSGQEPIYEQMWNESLAGVKKHLITYSSPHNFTVLAERPDGLNNKISPKMDHLVCFYPGTIALAVTGGLPLAQARKLSTWSEKKEEDIRLAEELMKTCIGMYKVTPTGLAPEIAHFNIHDPPLMYEDFTKDTLPKSPDVWGLCSKSPCKTESPESYGDFVIKANDAHNLQRPETVESLFYMWRITGDEIYRTIGWDMFGSFLQHTATSDGKGFSSLGSVLSIPPPLRDNMESFWLAETLKYFYLLFSSNDILPLTDVVFNTEAHPMPRFELGKLFKTGWQRGKQGSDAAPAARDSEHSSVVVEQVVVTKTVQQEIVTTATATEVQVTEVLEASTVTV